MNSKLKNNKIIFGLSTIFAALLMLTQLSFAATTDQKANPETGPSAKPNAATPAPAPTPKAPAATPAPTAGAAAEKPLVSDNLPLHVQYFKKGDLSIQLRYDADNKLVGISFKNTGKKAMDIRVLSRKYVLGANDEVVIDPPNIDYVRIVHQQHINTDLNTIAESILKQRFGSSTLLKMPPKHNNTSVQ